jgi:Mg2+ and Co2+ transporters
MTIYDVSKKALREALPASSDLMGDLFISCRESEMPQIQAAFSFDESTVLECTDLDESIRFASFDGYDFISLVNMESENEDILLWEINLYVAKDYMVMVLPDHTNAKAGAMESKILKAVKEIKAQKAWTNMAAYAVFNFLLSDISDMMETFEDEAAFQQENMMSNADKTQFERLSNYRHMAYIIKKQLRASSYLGAQMLIDPNGLIAKENRRYFMNIDARLIKLYGFSESLYELCNQLFVSYDSKLAMKTNDVMNKLTVITVFFGPLTVITGIYGMNFTFMPELQARWAYPVTLGVMLAISLVIFIWFKRKKWL